MSRDEEVVEDYLTTCLTLKDHPLALLRRFLCPEKRGNETYYCKVLASLPNEQMTSIAGLIVTHQHRGTASSVIF